MRSQGLLALISAAAADECDWRNKWRQYRWGNQQACFRDMGFQSYVEGNVICREEGASLPLPKNAEELESFLSFDGLDYGLLIDATDMDENGVWEDSNGNVVTYFPPAYYFPSGAQYSTIYSYQYMSIREMNANFVSFVTPDRGQARVYCQKPLNPTTPQVYEPPTPVQECDIHNQWYQQKWGSGQVCTKSLGMHPLPEAAARCREIGGQLPLPKNDEENEDFKKMHGKMLDATDLDGDGIWHDSYGNEVTYFPTLWYTYGPTIENILGGPYTYSYMVGANTINLNPQNSDTYAPIPDTDFVWTVRPNISPVFVVCHIPIASPEPPVPEPPAPVQECDWRNKWYQHRWGTGQACFKYIGYRQYDEAAAICREEGGSLPLPKNDEELESFRTGFAGLGSGLITDATDFDEDGVWEDSYGNVVTYFAPLHYYPSGRQYSTFNYQYMAVKEDEGSLVSYVVPNEGFSGSKPKGWVFCQLPLDQPTPTVHVPPTPVQECDVENDWNELKWGSGQACFKYMGIHPRPEAAALCREVGGQLPLPKNDEENNDFQSPNIRGKLTDATDLDGDGIWHDSYGNEVTYFAPLWHYPIENLQGGPWTYNYMGGSQSMFLTPEPEDADFVWTVYPNLGQTGVTCQVPLAPPKPPVPEPPTPVEECNHWLSWKPHKWGSGKICYRNMSYKPASKGADICRQIGGSLPLPKNDEENEDFTDLHGGLIDATDLDGDGVWEDSYGNEVTYFAPYVYYGTDTQEPSAEYSYQYIESASSSWTELLWYKRPDLDGFVGYVRIVCVIPLEPPPTPSCDAPTTYAQLFQLVESVIDGAVAEVSAWTPGQYPKRGIRAQNWLRSILHSTQRQLVRNCVRKLTTSPENIPDSLWTLDCNLGIDDTISFCNKFDDFLDWIFSECSQAGRDKKKNLLNKRCDKITSWKP